jgi:hypothetical protein
MIKIYKNITMIILAAFVWAILMFAFGVAVHAAPQYGFGTGQGRTGTVNVNDYHTSAWDRFSYNYEFSSGMEYRYDLGRSTTYDGFVPVDVYTANIRRDANVSLRPPRYGVVSGNIPTEPSNLLFEQPVNPNYSRTIGMDDPHAIPVYDTLQFGINAEPVGNPINMHNLGQQGQIQSTSIGGNDLIPIGASNLTGDWYHKGTSTFHQSGNASSTVTTTSGDGFLPPTSIRE